MSQVSLSIAKSDHQLQRRVHLIGVQGPWCSRRFYGAEAATPGACVTHQHNCGRSRVAVRASPALPNVGAASLFAYRAEVELPQVIPDLGELVSSRQGALQPVRLPSLLLFQTHAFQGLHATTVLFVGRAVPVLHMCQAHSAATDSAIS